MFVEFPESSLGSCPLGSRYFKGLLKTYENLFNAWLPRARHDRVRRNETANFGVVGAGLHVNQPVTFGPMLVAMKLELARRGDGIAPALLAKWRVARLPL